jgi:hypothetical protein
MVQVVKADKAKDIKEAKELEDSKASLCKESYAGQLRIQLHSSLT